MNIIYVVHRIPFPPNKGDKVRSYHTLRHLAARHHVWCACFVDDPADMQYVAPLREICRDVIAIPLNRRRATMRGLCNLARGAPASEGFYRDRTMTRRLRELSAQVTFDAALFFSSSMGQYADAVRADRKVIDFCDLDSRKWAELADLSHPPRSWLLRAEARLLAEREHELYEQSDATILISAAEAAGWRDHDREKLHIVGNGVALPELPADLRYDSGIVGFVGDMRYAPNVDGVCWFAQAIWPQIHATCPQAQFHIVGRGVPRCVQQLANVPGIQVIGEVPEVFPHLLNFQVVVAPLRIARGVQNKVLEAMAAARPVVATPQAAAGITGTPDQHLVVTGAADATASRIRGMLGRPEVCRRMGTQARLHVEANYAWGVQLACVDAILGVQPPVPAHTLSRSEMVCQHV